ncbi:putative Integral membrane protein [Seiridium unicorne]|uniref:Integral membrane protein n=1 Tax=Seiridium unicorne TaxID=138068 RepID=A0ABR2UUR0_9PEZI
MPYNARPGSEPMDLATTPGMAPPDGQASQFNAPYNSLQIGILISFGVTYFLATVFLALRAFQALKFVKKIELDLIIITLSYCVSLVYFVTMLNLMKFGWGKHLWDVSLADLIEFNKMAMLAVLYRINPSRTYRSVVVAAGIAIFAYTLTLCVITGGPCNPLRSGTTTCLENVALSQAALNIASDFAVVAIPIPTIHGLNLSRRQKLSVAALMALGSGVVICSIARLPYVIVLDHTVDVTYTEAILGVWSIVEVNLGIICSCSMRLKPLVVKYLPQLGFFSSYSRSTGKATYGSWGNGLGDESRSQHTYQLHSVQKSSADPVLDKGDIHVHRSYRVNVERNGGLEGGTVETLD